MNQPFDEITETLQDYFDGIYESSEEKMRRAFHPDAHVYSVVEGAIGVDLVNGRTRLPRRQRHGPGIRSSRDQHRS